MVESALSIGATELREEIAFFLNYGRTAGSWGATKLAEINGIMQSGVRRVYYPPAFPGVQEGYEWSWLRPTTTIDTESGTGDYTLPDLFGRLVGAFHFEADEYRVPIERISVGRLLEMRTSGDLSGAPVYVAIRYQDETDAPRTSGSRQEALFFPEPDAVWTLIYQYEAYSGTLTDELPYPLGGMPLAELYIESCLAVAEQRNTDEVGQHHQLYQALLVDAIARDKKRGAQTYGNMGNVERYSRQFRRGWTGGTYPITYKGDYL